MKLTTLLVLFSVMLSTLSFATESVDIETQCRPVKMDEPYRAFGFRLRETSAGLKMVKGSVYSRPRIKMFDTLMVRPQIKATDSEVEILAGKEPTWAAFQMRKNPQSGVWSGRIQIWLPNQTATFTSRVLCFPVQVYSNGQPVIR